jgi:hypothetical protein
MAPPAGDGGQPRAAPGRSRPADAVAVQVRAQARRRSDTPSASMVTSSSKRARGRSAYGAAPVTSANSLVLAQLSSAARSPPSAATGCRAGTDPQLDLSRLPRRMPRMSAAHSTS